MQQWEYLYVHFKDHREKFEIVCMPEGNGKVETTYRPDDMDAGQFFEVTLAKLGLKGWELAAAYNDNYYFKRPTE